jgi:hypothetical protein
VPHEELRSKLENIRDLLIDDFKVSYQQGTEFAIVVCMYLHMAEAVMGGELEDLIDYFLSEGVKGAVSSQAIPEGQEESLEYFSYEYVERKFTKLSASLHSIGIAVPGRGILMSGLINMLISNNRISIENLDGVTELVVNLGFN